MYETKCVAKMAFQKSIELFKNEKIGDIFCIKKRLPKKYVEIETNPVAPTELRGKMIYD